MESLTLFKVLGPGGAPINGGNGAWYLPNGNRPGRWMPKITTVIPCQSGYHVCRIENLFDWITTDHAVVWTVESRGEVVDAGDKIVVGQARLLRRTAWSPKVARLFAVDCAERVLPIFEQAEPGDDRPRKAIDMARRYANGDATAGELAAAWKAARVAAASTAQAAAWAAAETAARAAAEAAAWAAARAAARAAAETTERQWQNERLAAYLNGMLP